jgi:hypothetical protein
MLRNVRKKNKISLIWLFKLLCSEKIISFKNFSGKKECFYLFLSYICADFCLVGSH